MDSQDLEMDGIAKSQLDVDSENEDDMLIQNVDLGLDKDVEHQVLLSSPLLGDQAKYWMQKSKTWYRESEMWRKYKPSRIKVYGSVVLLIFRDLFERERNTGAVVSLFS
jgi:hypothetical protein